MNVIAAAWDWNWRKLRRMIQFYAPSQVKRALWNSEFANGHWNCLVDTPGDPVYTVLEKYANGRNILDMGCGSGNTAMELDESCFSSYTGVDISDAAVAQAAARAAEGGRQQKASFVQGDFLEYAPNGQYRLILFRDSLYYANITMIQRILDRYADSLEPGGVFVVRLQSGMKKQQAIVQSIERRFTIVEKKLTASPPAVILVFQPNNRLP